MVPDAHPEAAMDDSLPEVSLGDSLCFTTTVHSRRQTLHQRDVRRTTCTCTCTGWVGVKECCPPRQTSRVGTSESKSGTLGNSGCPLLLDCAISLLTTIMQQLWATAFLRFVWGETVRRSRSARARGTFAFSWCPPPNPKPCTLNLKPKKHEMPGRNSE
jgi:hypothetical protein